MNTERAKVRRGYVTLPQGQVHYAEAGFGEPLLLMGGTPRSHRSFLRLMSLLVPHFRVLAVDMPGFGNSDPLMGEVTVPRLAERMVAFLDGLGLDKAHVFGLHTGNKLGVAMAAQWSSRIDHLILAGQSHSIIPDIEARNAVLQPYYEKYKTHFRRDEAGSFMARAWLNAQVIANSLWWPKNLLTGASVLEEDLENAEAVVLDSVLGWRSAVSYYEAVLAYDLGAAYRKIRAPTLVLELYTRPETHLRGQAERVCALIPGAVADHIDEATGLAVESRPEEFAAPILKFLRAGRS